MNRSNIHDISSQTSNNQFMTGQMSTFTGMPKNNSMSEEEKDKIFAFMKNIVSNPLLREQMEKHFTQKDTHNKSYFMTKQNQNISVSRYQQEIRPEPVSYIIQPSNQIIPEPLRDPNQSINFKKTFPTALHKKGKDVLSNFNSNQSRISDQSKQQILQPKSQQIQPIVNNIKHSFEDIPIKSNYINNIQGSQFAYEDQSTIYPEHNKQNPKKFVNNTKKDNDGRIKMQNNNKYIELEERPINGTKKQFRELLKEKFEQTPFDNYINQVEPNIQKSYNDEQNENEINQNQVQRDDEGAIKKSKKQFLKRGTRQYLSSAKDKVQKNVKKGNNDPVNLNISRLDKDERDKTPKREVSQNRVLSKRNTNNNDKSMPVIKQEMAQFQKEYKDESNYDNQPNYKRSITPKNQRINNKKDKSPGLPPKNSKTSQPVVNQNSSINSSKNNEQRKKDSKNVFNDDSSEQSEGVQQANDFKTRQNNFMSKEPKSKLNNYHPQKQYTMFERQKKTQVIEGVYLTKNQLEIILQKYSSEINQSKNMQNDNKNQLKFMELRKKYTDLCHLLEIQKAEHEQQMQKERQQFQAFKANETQKMKNEKRVMERQLKSTMPSQSHNTQKDREQVQNLKKEMQRQRDEQRKKDKNNKILIDKYKKENEDLKSRIDKLELDLQKAHSMPLSNQNSFSNLNSQKNLSRHTNDKSQSKIIGNKQVSPFKNKHGKSVHETNENQQEEDNKHFKKTVPIRPSKEVKHTKNNSYECVKKDKSFDIYQKDESDDNLPTFKVTSNKNQSKQIKQNQKKYQYFQNNSEQQNVKNTSKVLSSKITVQNKKKNVFSNKFGSSSSQQSKEQEGSDEDYNHQTQKQIFLKNSNKFNKLVDLVNNKFTIKDVTPEIISNLFRYENNEEYLKYIQKTHNARRVIVNSSQNGVDRKITNIYNDKSKQMLFQNGVKKVIFETGYLIIYFKNGDIKQTLSDGTILYYFKQKQVDQITLTNGINIYRFDNNQVELHFDGGKYIEIRHPDGTIKVLGSPVH